jgi:hypothetical protein
MCEQCLTNPISFGDPLEGWVLMRARRDGNDWMKGEWALIECNDPTFRWTMTPVPSPTFGITEAEEDAWFEAHPEEEDTHLDKLISEGFYKDFEKHFENGSLMDGYNLISAAIKKGYDKKRHGDFKWWLFDYLGEYLKTAEMVEEGDPFPQREEFAPSDLTIGKD